MGSTTEENFEAQSHQFIWDNIKGGSGAEPLGSTAFGWGQLAGRVAAIRGYIDGTVRGIRSTQEGAAADAAAAAISPIGPWLDEAQRQADAARDLIFEQTESFNHTNNAMPPVRQIPDGGWREWPVIDSFTTSDADLAEQAAAEDEREARRLMSAYQDSSNGRMTSMPQFVEPAQSTAALDIASGQQVHAGQPGGSGPSVGGGAGGGPVSPFSGTAAGGGYQPPGPTQSQGVVPAAGAPAGAAANAGDAGSRAGSPGMTGPGGVGPGGFVPGTSRTPGSRPGSAAARPGWAGGRPPSATGRGGVPGGPAHGSDSGVRGGGGFGPRGSGTGAGPGGLGRAPESGARPGFGGGPTAAEGATGRPSAAGARGGPAGFAPFGGAAGRGQGEDRERERPSYLIEQDRNAIVGDLPPTVPPVIGEDPPGQR